MINRLNASLDRLLSEVARYGFGPRQGYRRLGLAGLALAVISAPVMAWQRGLSVGICLWTVTICLAASYVFAVATKVLHGAERLVFYHYFLLIVATSGIFLWLAGQPALPYLEILILALGLLQATGRLGCLAAGCCHGRPARVGIVYTSSHLCVAQNFQGARLFPVQLLESLWSAGALTLSIERLVSGAPSGEAVAMYLLLYAGGRFACEEARGDAGRPHWLGWSQAQWISGTLFVLIVAVRTIGFSGGVDAPLFKIEVIAGLLMATAIVWHFRAADRSRCLHLLRLE